MIRFASACFVLLVAILAIGSSAIAEVAKSPRPEPRPAGVKKFAAAAEPVTYIVRVGYNAKVRPKPRPKKADTIVVTRRSSVEVVKVASVSGLRVSPRPEPRKKGSRLRLKRTQTVALSVTRPKTKTTKSGKICGDKKIRGREVARVSGRLRGCGIADPVQVTEISGVRLSTASTMNCATARALKTWIETGLKPSAKKLGGGADTIKVAAHYSCRTRNNRKGAKLSEHGKGNAIDISAITLKNGATMTVLNGWNEKVQKKPLRQMHAAACGPFTTVLGPNADRHHRDHFHFDIAPHRDGRRYSLAAQGL